MNKNQFMKYAGENKLSAGLHFCILNNGIVQAFTIFADKYDGILMEYNPKHPDYMMYLRNALLFETTLHECHAASAESQPAITQEGYLCHWKQNILF